jgi:large subunit ribosomal protein L25
MEIDGTEHLCVFHEAQYHPVTDEALNVDFLSISTDKPVVIDVPVVITGNSEGVKQGGKLVPGARKLKVSGLIKDLPDTLSVDITNLTIGKQINAGDLSYENIQIVSPKTTMVCAVKATRASAAAARG